MVISLGREKMDMRLARFMQVYSKTYAGLKGDLKYVDLRYPSGFAVRSPMALAAFKPAAVAVEPKEQSQNHVKNEPKKETGKKASPKKDQGKKDIKKPDVKKIEVKKTKA